MAALLPTNRRAAAHSFGSPLRAALLTEGAANPESPIPNPRSSGSIRSQENTMTARALVVAALCALAPVSAFSQALTSLASVRVGYTTRKNTVKPQGELKTQIDALDAQIAEATRLGRTGELRRLYAKGLALLNGRPWTDAADYAASLVLRSARVVVDSSKPYTVRLEQIYA